MAIRTMGCIRVPNTAIKAVFEAKMHPPLLLCAYFGKPETVVHLHPPGSFWCPTVLHSDGKDTAMKNNETKKRIVHHKLEVGKALSLEPTIMLDVYDHEMDLQDRYEDEQLNPLFDTKVVNYKANNSMGRDDYREERVKRAVKKYGKTLWHYTDINALCGIIGKKEIWFGSAEHMNDREELIGFINDLEKEVYACIDSANKGKANEVFSQIKNRMQKEYPYIFCVSKARNDAAQWDRYAQGGQGVAIVFNTETLFKLIFYNQIIMNEEYYGYCAKQHKTKELLRDYIQYDKMDDFSNLNGLIDNLLLCAMFHKHESFSSEQEIRISPLFVNENDKHLQCKVLNTIRQVYILNLAELCEKERIDFEDLFDSIVIGPTSKQTIRDLQIYCKNNGLLKLANKVKKSDCPLR